MRCFRSISPVILAVAASACVGSADPVDTIATDYVKAVLALGHHDPDYVDAYYGPEAWRAEVDSLALTLTEVREQALTARAALGALPTRRGEPDGRRRAFLDRHLAALITRADMLLGAELSFDDESAGLYDAVAPAHPAEFYESALSELNALLPGSGPVTARLADFRADFVIPTDRLDSVFQRAITECRARTAAWMDLPADESFTVEYVTDKSWSGYNWYQGGHASVIQLNTDFPVYVDRALDLACHEGYPGHHALNVSIESHLVEARGWVEYSVYPLFSPLSLIAEGSANYGVTLTFPGEERTVFEQDVLFPAAGLDPERAAEYRRVMQLAERLAYAGNEAARGYLDGVMEAEDAVDWLTQFALMAPDRARQRLRFIEQYRSYVINYNLGRDLVAAHVETAPGAGSGDRAAEWLAFAELLREPPLPSDLRTRD
jgi:hypothetical protein